MKSRKIVSLFLVLAFLLSFAVVPVAADAPGTLPYTVGISWDNTNPNVGDVVTATVYLEQMTDIAAFQFDIAYDPSVIQLWDGSEQAVDPSDAIDDSAFMAIKQKNHSGSQKAAFDETPGISGDTTKGLIDLVYSSKLEFDGSNYSSFNPSSATSPATSPNSPLDVVTMSFVALKNGNPNIRIANNGEQAADPTGEIYFPTFGGTEYVSGLTEAIDPIRVGPDFTPRSVPVVGFTAPSVYGATDAQITGTDTTMEYSTDQTNWTACSDGSTTVGGKGTYYVINAAIPEENLSDSDPAIVTIPDGPKSTPNAPTGLAGVAPTSALTQNDGQITGTDSTMEYSTTSGGTYTPCTANPTTGLAPNTYYVRVAATSTANAGLDATVNVPANSTPITSYARLIALTELRTTTTAQLLILQHFLQIQNMIMHL